jgi:hypothetical protein
MGEVLGWQDFLDHTKDTHKYPYILNQDSQSPSFDVKTRTSECEYETLIITKPHSVSAGTQSAGNICRYIYILYIHTHTSEATNYIQTNETTDRYIRSQNIFKKQ